jgi:hypothetical protein
MAQSTISPASTASAASVPRAAAPAGTFFNDFRTAMHDYPEQFVELEIVDVAFPGSVLNAGDEGTFKVQVRNNGLLDMTDVSLKVRGLAGTLVRTGSAADQTYRQELTIGMESETIAGQGGVSVTQGSKLKFKAPAGTRPAGTPLFEATIANWNGNLVRLLNGHSHGGTAPAGTYSNQVVGQ